MDGGTTFTSSRRAFMPHCNERKDAASGQDVRLGGGVATIRQYLQARLIDELHIAVSPVILGSGEPLLASIDTLALGYECSEHVTTAKALHVVLTKRT
jgi:dihydrofolate reductase